MLYAEVEVLRAIVDKILILMLMLLLTKVGVEGMVELSPEEVVVLGEGDQAELECKVIASSMSCWSARQPRCCNIFLI